MLSLSVADQSSELKRFHLGIEISKSPSSFLSLSQPMKSPFYLSKHPSSPSTMSTSSPALEPVNMSSSRSVTIIGIPPHFYPKDLLQLIVSSTGHIHCAMVGTSD